MNYSKAAAIDHDGKRRALARSMHGPSTTKLPKLLRFFQKGGNDSRNRATPMPKANGRSWVRSMGPKYFAQVLAARPDVLQVLRWFRTTLKLLVDHQRYDQC